MMKKPPLLILAGPTAAGKTSLSIRLAKQINGSVISADSMQVYRGMDIGSAKITQQEMEDVPHYLIDALCPQESFHIAAFQQMAKQAMAEIYAAGSVPILVGGTGFYIQSVLYNIDFTTETPSDLLRGSLLEFAQKEGNDALHARLKKADPASACAIHPNNVKRVVRALEFFIQNGYPISRHNETERAKEPPYRFAYFVLNDRREAIYDKIDRRVDRMMEQGLLAEVKRLKERGCHSGMPSMQGLGYKELLAYLDGEYSFEEAVRLIKRDTRRFAKRQLTWFAREKDAIWIQKDQFSYDEDAILGHMISIIKERKVLP